MVSPSFRTARVEIEERIIPSTPLIGTPTTVAIIGIAKGGPVNELVEVSSQAEFLHRFGGAMTNRIGIDPITGFNAADPANQFKQAYGALLALRVLGAGGRVEFVRVADGTQQKAKVRLDVRHLPAFIVGKVALTGGLDTRQRNVLHIRVVDGGHVLDKEINFTQNASLPFSSIITTINTQFKDSVITYDIAARDKTGRFLFLKVPSDVVNNTATAVPGNSQTWQLRSGTVNKGDIVQYSFSCELVLDATHIVRAKDDGSGVLVDNGSVGVSSIGGTIDYTTGSVTLTWSGQAAVGGEDIAYKFEYRTTLEIRPASDSRKDAAITMLGFAVQTKTNVPVTKHSAIATAVFDGTLMNGTLIRVEDASLLDYGIRLQVVNDSAGVNLIVDNIAFEDVTEVFRTRLTDVITLAPDTGEDLGFLNTGGYIMTDGQDGVDGLTQAHWLTGLEVFKQKTSEAKILALVGIWDPMVLLSALSYAEEKKSVLIVFDLPSTLTPEQAIDFKHGRLGGYNDVFDIQSSFITTLYPWTEEFIESVSKIISVPASVSHVMAMVNTDHTVGPWNAPSGISRGLLKNVVNTRPLLSVSDGDSLVAIPNSINPILKFKDTGFVIWGQMTMEPDVTKAVTRLNVRRNIIHLARDLASVLKPFLFESITPALLTRANLVVGSRLDFYVGQGAIIQYSVNTGPEINTPEVIADNTFIVEVKVQPVTAAELIRLVITVVSGVGISVR